MKTLSTSLVFFVVTSFNILFGAALAFADQTIPDSPPPAWRQGYYAATLSSEFFSSNSNYNDGRGSFSKLNNGDTITTFENRLKARYATSDNLYLFGGTGFTQTHAVDSGLNQDKNNSQFNNVFGGADFLLNRRWMNIVPEVEGSWPLDAPNGTQTVPMTSEGAAYLRAGTFLFKRYEHFRVESYFGLHVPAEDLAKRFMYSLFGEIAFLRGFTFGGGIDGYETVLVDGKTQAVRTAFNAQTDATSARFRAWDPALLEGRLWIGFRPDRAFTFRLGFAKTLNGVRAAAGQSILLNISFNSPGSSTTRVTTNDGVTTTTTTTRTTHTSRGTRPTAPSARSQPKPEEPPPQPPKLDNGSDMFTPEPAPGDSSLDDTEKMLERQGP